MNTIPNKNEMSGSADSKSQLFGNVSPVFEYWCLDCDEFFDSKELLSECPECHSSMKDSLVQIYMEHDPVPDQYKTLKDWGEGG